LIVGSTLNELTQGLGIRLVRGREERPLASSFVGLGRVRVTDPAGSLAARPKRWKPSPARPQLNGSHSAQRSYERYVALGQEGARSGNVVGAENYYQHAEHYFRLMSSNREAT
jgi:Domain of unknown function (DUF4167)